MRVGKHMGCVLLAMACSACVTTPDAPKDFLREDLSGRIDNRDWRYRYAYIDPTVETPEEDDVVIVFLPYKPKAACPTDVDDKADSRHVRVTAPKAVKLVKIKAGSSRNLAFQYQLKGGDPYVSLATRGKIQITSVSQQEVKGRVLGVRNDNLWVSGNFSAYVCNRMDFR